MAGPVLEINNVSISFFTRAGDIPAVMDFSARIDPGETLALVGESGCGKSTVALGVMRDLGANGRITGGSIRFKGREITTMTDADLRQIRGSEISMVYQEPMASLNPAMIVGRQLLEVPTTHQSASHEQARIQALRAIDAVRLPDAERIFGSYPHQLSGGQQQRIVIAMALMSEPSLLILDEPTTALDVTVEAGIVDLIRDLGREFGTSMLFISHNLGLVLDTCDRICVMYSGEAVETGPVTEIFDSMRHPYTQGLMRSIPLPGTDRTTRPLVPIRGSFPLPRERPPGCNFAPRCDWFEAGRCDTAEIPMFMASPDHATRCMRAREIDWTRQPEIRSSAAALPAGPVVLEARDLKKHYTVATSPLFGGDARVVKANEDISFKVREAETLAIVGESGCGKSTLAKVLLGLETATAGTVNLDGEEIARLPVEGRDTHSVSSIQMVFQNPFDTLNPSHTVGGQIIRALEKFEYGTSQTERKARMFELMDMVKLPRAFATRMPRQLSGGQKQRIGIARAFAGTPRVLVADEPVSALDVSVQAAVAGLLADIQRQGRTAMIFISHDLSIVRYLADRAMVMYLGYVVETGNTEQVFQPPFHPYTEALLSAVPIPDTSVKRERMVLQGDIPSPINTPSGCPFQTRCPRKSEVAGKLCDVEMPPMRALAAGHQIRCHLPQSVLDVMVPVMAGKPAGTVAASQLQSDTR